MLLWLLHTCRLPRFRSWSRRRSLNIKAPQPATGAKLCSCNNKKPVYLSSSCSWELNFSFIICSRAGLEKVGHPNWKSVIRRRCEWTLWRGDGPADRLSVCHPAAFSCYLSESNVFTLVRTSLEYFASLLCNWPSCNCDTLKSCLCRNSPSLAQLRYNI